MWWDPCPAMSLEMFSGISPEVGAWWAGFCSPCEEREVEVVGGFGGGFGDALEPSKKR